MGTRAGWRNGKSRTSFDDLPSEMAVNILSRLPVKSIIRSTSVSKTWYSLIINPSFISSHITHSLSSCDETAVLIIPTNISHRNYCTLVSARTGYVFDEYEIPFTTKTGTLKLVGSVNGLLCLTELHSSNPLYLWNPCLRKYKLLDSTCFPADLFGHWRRRSYAIGLGFHQPSCDYRVVKIVSCVDNKGDLVEKVVPKIEVFSLRMNTWREIPNPIGTRVASFKLWKSINNILYGLSTGRTETYSEEMWILSFDFNDEVFRKWKLPDAVRYCLGETAFFNLMTFEGSLCVCVFDIRVSGYRNTEPCCIWLMKNEDGNISWTQLFNVLLKKFIGFLYELTKSGELIMISSTNWPVGSIISYNLTSHQSKHLVSQNLYDDKVKFPATVDTSFIESLVMHAGGYRLLKSEK